MNKGGFAGRAQTGYSIIEVLVAVLVMTLGILGITGLQTLCLKYGTQSTQRTKAAYLSYEILDRMRANPGQLYSVDLDVAPTDQQCFAEACSADQLMAFDIAQWKCALGKHAASPACVALTAHPSALIHALEALPGGDGVVTCTLTGATKACTVTVVWEERSEPGSTTVKVRNFQLTATI